MHLEGEDWEEGGLACTRGTHDGKEVSAIDPSSEIVKDSLISFFVSKADVSPLEDEVIVNSASSLFVYHLILD